MSDTITIPQPKLPKLPITLGAKVTVTDQGDGIIFGVIRRQPKSYDVYLLKDNKLVPYLTDKTVLLIDSNPVNDPDVPQNVRDWLVKRPAI